MNRHVVAAALTFLTCLFLFGAIALFMIAAAAFHANPVTMFLIIVLIALIYVFIYKYFT